MCCWKPSWGSDCRLLPRRDRKAWTSVVKVYWSPGGLCWKIILKRSVFDEPQKFSELPSYLSLIILLYKFRIYINLKFISLIISSIISGLKVIMTVDYTCNLYNVHHKIIHFLLTWYNVIRKKNILAVIQMTKRLYSFKLTHMIMIYSCQNISYIRSVTIQAAYFIWD